MTGIFVIGIERIKMQIQSWSRQQLPEKSKRNNSRYRTLQNRLRTFTTLSWERIWLLHNEAIMQELTTTCAHPNIVSLRYLRAQ